MSKNIFNYTNNPIIGIESIDFQLDDTAQKLEDIFTKIREVVLSNASRPEYPLDLYKYNQQLEDLVYRRFGLKTIFKNRDCFNAYVEPMVFNKHHILLKSIWHNKVDIYEQNKLIKESIGKKGFVDLKNAKVGGIFSEYRHQVGYDPKSFFNIWNLTPMELSAIIMHEIGHAFSYYEYADRLETTNQVLLEIAEKLSANKKDNTEYMLNELVGNQLLTDSDKQSILDSKNRNIMGIKLFKALHISITSQLKDLTYNKTSNEQLADNFATKFGIGRELIVGLDKIHRLIGSDEKYFSSWLFLRLQEALSVISSVFLLIFSILGFLTFLGIIFAMYSTGAMLFAFANSGVKNEEWTYDKLKIRYQRIRNQVVEQLKQPDLDKDFVINTIESIKEIDVIIDNTHERNSLFDMVMNLITIGSNKTKESIIYQQLLERLASNDLFISHAQLSTL